jgi:hypothetical protein
VKVAQNMAPKDLEEANLLALCGFIRHALQCTRLMEEEWRPMPLDGSTMDPVPFLFFLDGSIHEGTVGMDLNTDTYRQKKALK